MILKLYFFSVLSTLYCRIDIAAGIGNEFDCYCPDEPIIFTKHEQGVIKPPISPHSQHYCPNAKCSWQIEAGEQGTGIHLEFDWFETESGHDFLDIQYIGTPEEYNITQHLTSLTGTLDPQYIPEYTFNNKGAIQLTFYSDFGAENRGFHLEFSRFKISKSECACSPIVHKIPSNGSIEITSPNYPQPHCHASECFYLLMADENNEIHIHFDDFDLEKFDFLQIFDGNSTVTSLARLSGVLSEAEKSITSTASEVFMVFRSDIDVAHRGFKATVTQKSKTCDCPKKAFTDPEGSISSPGFSKGKLCREMTCHYTIQTAEGTVIQLEFSVLEMQNWDSLCLFNAGQDLHGYPLICWRGVHDMRSSNRTLKFTAETNKIILVLETGATKHTTEYKGFSLKYSSIHRPGDCGCPVKNHKILLDKQAVITANACSSMDCIYVLDQQNLLSLHQMDLLSYSIQKLKIHHHGSGDYLKLYQGMYNKQNNPFLLKTFSDPVNKPTEMEYLSVNGKIMVHFHTEEEVHGTDGGLTMQYSWEAQNCECGELRRTATEKHQFLTSPGFPKPYCNDLTCDWVIVAPEKHRVMVVVTQLQTEKSDRLEFFDGLFGFASLQNNHDKLLQIMSGNLENHSTKTVYSSGTAITVVFSTDFVAEGRGFNLTYYSESADKPPTVAPTAEVNNSSTTTVQLEVVSPEDVDKGEIVHTFSWVPIILVLVVIVIVVTVTVFAVYHHRKNKRSLLESARISFARNTTSNYIENRCYDSQDMTSLNT